MNLIIEQEFKELIPPLSPDEYSGLEKSLLAEGCRDALVVWNGVILDGHNRYEICKKYGIEFKTIEKSFSDKDAAKVWIIENQFSRRNLPPYVRGELMLKLKPLIAAKAKESYKSNVGRPSKSPQNSATISNVETRKELSKLAGVSHDTISRIEKIAAKAPEEIKTKLRAGEMSVNEAYIRLKRAEKEKRQEEARLQNSKLVQQVDPIVSIDGKYQTIVIDPPWDWGDEGDVNQLGRAKPEYKTMSFEELMNFPIADKAAENCHIYLWITNRSLPKGFELLNKWGFRYITAITWCKPFFGMGNYFRGSTEHVLFGVKGSLELLRKDVGTWFEAPRGEKHSQKPEEFYKLVESCSPGPWLDVFARKRRSGWVTWGGEV